MNVLYVHLMLAQSKQTKGQKKQSFLNSLLNFYSRYMLIIWLSIIIIPITIITIGCILVPELFYDQFVWRYFWGTIEADAQEESYGEVTEAYNPVNTIFYAIIVIIVIYWLYKLFKKYEIELDFKFFIAIIPFISLGSITRVLEDAELFTGPIVYLFIAPIIYIVVGVMVIVFIVLAAMIRNYSANNNLEKGIIVSTAFLIGLDIAYLLSYFLIHDQFSYMLHPMIPILISLIIIYFFMIYTRKIHQFDISVFLLSIGVWFLIIGTIVLCQWQTIPSWTDAYLTANPDNTITLQPSAFFLVLGLTILGVFIVYILAKLLTPRFSSFKPFLLGINLTLFFGHFLDASATFVAIDYYCYAEKHVLPTFMIELFHTAAVMYLLKAIIIILVIYFIDILYEKDFRNSPRLTGLVKIAILVLGLGPGIRDVVRLAIGV